MLTIALALTMTASVVVPIDVRIPGDIPTQDHWVAGDTDVTVYVDHLRVRSRYPLDEYSFYQGYKEGVFASRMQLRSKELVQTLVKSLELGKVSVKDVGRDEIEAFKRKTRVVVVVATRGKADDVYFVSQCRYLKDGSTKIRMASPELIRFYSGPWASLANCQQ